MIDDKRVADFRRRYFYFAYDRLIGQELIEILDTLSAALRVVEAAKEVLRTRPTGWNTDGIPELRKSLSPFTEQEKK